MNFTKAFGGLSKKDADIAGGKGASLGEMTGAGIPVPPGFVVLSSTFDHFIKETDLVEEIDSILHSVDHKAVHTVDAASEKIRGLIESREMPQDIAAEIVSEFTKLGADFVAVRSSATAEDGAEHAWAGQLESYLNTTDQTLLENVKHCWASLFTPRAIFYRFEKGLHSTSISVAVVVQKMVQSEVSGIAFSVHPVTEDYNQLIIEAGFGLGEAIVSGSVTPDSYVVEKNPRNVLDINVSTQSRALYKKPEGGNEWQDIPEPRASSQVLSDPQIRELAEIIVGIENHYGFPCDIEWAFEGGKFYITQSRPITTLSPKSTGLIIDGIHFTKMGRWATMPLDTETWHTEHTSRYFEEKFGIWKEILALHVFDGDDFYNEMYAPTSFIKKLHKHIADIVAKDKKGMEKILRKFYGEKDDIRRDAPKINPKNLSQISNAELALAYERNRDAVHAIVSYDQFTWLAEGYWLPLMDKILIEKAGLTKGSLEYTEALFALIKPEEISTTLEEKREVFAEAISIKSGKGDIKKSAERLAKDYGWMPVLAFGVPWQASHYVGELEEVAKHDEKTLEEEYEKLKKYSELQQADFKKTVKKYGLSEDDAQVFIDFGLAIDARNEAEYMNSICGFHVLALYDEIAKRFGVSITELRMLFESEILALLREGGDARTIIAAKKPIVSWFVTAEKKLIRFTPEEGPKVVEYLARNHVFAGADETGGNRGITANKGKVRGIARLVPSPEDNHKVGDGDILFAYSTMVDNLPAMKRAAAYVTESGGLTCHAAVVAREFGVPAIVSYKGAMTDFEDGDLVEVDADNGIVTKLESSKKKVKFNTPGLENLNVEDYFYFGLWKQDLFSACFWHQSYAPEIVEKLGISLDGSYSLGFGGHFLIRRADLEEVRRQLSEKIASKDERFFKNLIEVTNSYYLSAFDKGNKLREARPTGENFARFVEIANKINFLWLLGASYFIEAAERALQDAAVKVSFPAEQILNIIPKVISPLYQRGRELVELKREIGNKSLGEVREDSELYAKLVVLAEKYPWVEVFNFIGDIMTPERVYEEVSHMPVEVEEHEIKVEVSSDLKWAAQCMNYCGYVKQAGAEYFSIFSERVRPFLENIATELGLTYRELMALNVDEVDRALKGEISKSELKTRVGRRTNENWGFLAFSRGKNIFFEDSEDLRVIADQAVPKADAAAREVHGVTGNPGVYTGPVRVVMNTDEFHKMQVGDVLVSTMTTPDFVVLMQKAGAIVTDIGGLLCHAAIVSREINKPCVIGTKFATQLLEDGMMVEVDAEKGVVRII